MPLSSGGLVLEDLAAQLGCRVRALSHLKVHRVRYSDFNVATTLESCSQEWLARFRMLEADTQEHLEHRGGAARGVVDALQEHVFNEDLTAYGERRMKAISVTRSMKLKRGTLLHDFSVVPSERLGRMPHPIVNVAPKSWKMPSVPRQASAPAGLLSAAERTKLKAIQRWPGAYSHLSATFPKTSGETLAKELFKAKGNEEKALGALKDRRAAKTAESAEGQRTLRLPDLAVASPTATSPSA
ncbi:Hypothetical protein SCF082_LOCUS22030 [Durusdinium trenchii]